MTETIRRSLAETVSTMRACLTMAAIQSEQRIATASADAVPTLENFDPLAYETEYLQF
jgi:hypothetical protein